MTTTDHPTPAPESSPPPAEMIRIANALATAKSRQDIEAAMDVYHPDGVLEAPPLGSRRAGATQIRAALKGFFSLFPDYSVTLDDQAVSGDTLIAWGTIHLTLSGNPGGQTPNGARASVPVFILFRFRDGRVIWESFNFDLASLCRQCGVPLAAFHPAH
ncbi:ester cyclase [Reyranella sp. CPCC 100927]|uniref:ester cyclase n=1 Tax=Reyranella sp. CPCC 100927 TaxID=2599616 RepID=UPI001C498B24|nr:nuclear transport factor 2 family protein [Reyranella sp. CPCC 100927]